MQHPHHFWAVKIPDHVKQTIHDEITKRQHIFQFLRWVHRQDYHITLAFLGGVEEQRRDLIVNLVEAVIQNQKKFPLQVQGLGIFGNRKSPRIFWSAVNEEQSLYELQSIVHQTCVGAGFLLESRRYHPHITIARKWNGDEYFDVNVLEKYNPFLENPLVFEVSEIVLYRTNIEKTPKYEVVASFTIE